MIDVILNRKSVRKFTSESVDTKDVITLIKCGMAAPSAMDRRLWEFIVVTDRTKLDSMAEKLPYAKMLFTAPMCIVVCGNILLMPKNRGEDYWVQDCAAATENILIAAESLGLGAVWTAAYPSAERVEIVKQTLNIPENIVPLNVIPIGHPDGNFSAKDKYDETKIHYENW